MQLVRFFILIIPIAFMFSCSSGKKVITSTKNNTHEDAALLKDLPKLSQYSADDLFMEAVKAKILGKKEEAFRKYSLFAMARPANAAAHYELSRMWFEQSNAAKALNEIQLALRSDSTNKWMLKQYADILSFNGQYVDAATIYGKIAAKERTPEEFLIRQAMLYQKAGKHTEALNVLDKLAQYIGEDDEILSMQREQVYLSMNNVEGAADEVRKLMKYYPYEAKYALHLAELYENNNIEDKARQAYQDVEAKFPDEGPVQFALVQYYLKNKDLKQVEYYLSKAVMNKSVSTEDRIALLVPFIQYRGVDSSSKGIAFDLARKLAEQQPPQVEAISLYADLLMADRKVDEALEQYKRVVTVAPSMFSAWQQVMFLYLTRTDNDSLVAYAERAVRVFPQESMAYYLGGLGYMQLKQNNKAVDYLSKAIQYHKDNNDDVLSEMLVSLGDVYNIERRYASSDSCYKAALALKPNNATALNNYSYYLSLRGENLDEAEKMSAKSLKLRPDEATFLDTYGWILYKQGKYEEAKTYILKAIESNKESPDPTLWEHLGDIEYKLGNKQQAVEHWKTASLKGESSDSLQQKINEKILHD